MSYTEGFWQTIPGWFDYADIYDQAVAEARDGAQFVEIGCWLGRSTCYLAEAVAKSGKDIPLWVVDTFCGVPEDELQPMLESHGGSVYEAFLDNLTKAGFSPSTQLRILREDSKTAHRHFSDDSLDFIFVDADHSYEGVRTDVINWLPKVRRQGILAGHDYGHSEVVRRAVDELLGRCPASAASWLTRP